MEADWEFEVGPDAPVIDAHWDGLLDLTTHPEQAATLPESAGIPQLAGALIRLNQSGAPTQTSKCDTWQVDLNEAHLDPDELGAPTGTMQAAWACYIDLTAREHRWETPEAIQQDCAALTSHLRAIALRCCRADLVIRRAIFSGDKKEFGITAYLTACGPSEELAKEILGKALQAFTDSVLVTMEKATGE